MKKFLGIFAIIVTVLIIILGWNFYANNYQQTPAYAVVPQKMPTKQATVDDDGKTVPNSYSYKYNFNFVLENGEKRQMHYELMGKEPTPLTPGSTIKAYISKKRVVSGPNTIAKKDIPAKVQRVLNIN